jgi:hypothetical protein
LLGAILAVGAGLRLYGLNWDGGHWLHPDERQIYFVTLSLRWPQSLAQAFRPDSSLNPHFFAYGSLPIYLLKLVSVLAAPLSPLLRDPDNLHLIGRPLAALFDLASVYLTYRLARIILSSPRSRAELRGGALLAAALFSLAVLSVQHAHFYTADTLLTFFVVLTLNLAADVVQGGGGRRQIALGIALGLALATKVSAAPLLLVVLVAFALQRITSGKEGDPAAGHHNHLASRQPAPVARSHHLSPITSHLSRITPLLPIARGIALTGIVAGCAFVAVQPYALIDWRTFLADTLRESQIAWGILDVPYTRQYADTLPYLYSIWQTALWGLGLPLGLVAGAGFAAALVHWLRRGAWAETLLLAWAGPYLAITGLLHTRYLRYMLPLVPILCVLVARVLTPHIRPSSIVLRRPIAAIASWALVLCTLAYALAFASIYAVPHSWIATSEWIYRDVPAGSSLAVEGWDTALPLPLDVDGQPRRIQDYTVRVLALYDEPDDVAKWSSLAVDLSQSDYIIIASRRLYGSIPRLPDRYPLASHYYDRLFAGELGFELAGEFTRGPAWLNPSLPPVPDAAPAWLHPDESFVVYDHPRALVFHNVEHLNAAELFRRLTGS